MRVPLCSLAFGAVGGPTGAIEAVVAGEPVPPAFTVSGPRPQVEAGAGVGEGACLAFTGCARDDTPFAAPFLRDPRLTAGMNGARSVTVTGWYRAESVYDDSGHDYAFHSPWLSMFFHEKGKDSGALKINGESGSAVLWTTMHGHSVSVDSWVFYAFTYDGRREEGNCLSYSGTDEEPVRLTWTASAAVGRLRAVDEASLVIGAATPQGAYAFTGRLDHVRIYTSLDGEEPAILTVEELEALRRADLGDGWPARLEARRRREAEEQGARREALRRQHYGGLLNVVQVDPLDSVFPDRPAAPIRFEPPFGAARGGSATWQFVVQSPEGGRCRIDTEPLIREHGESLGGKIRTFVVQAVPVEANTNGGSRTAVGRRPSAAWLRQFIREAPFEVAEVTREERELTLSPGRYHAVLIVVEASRDEAPGLYRGAVRFTVGAQTVSHDYALRVYPTLLPEAASLHITYWLSPDPKDLTSGTPPAWWSEDHWRLLESTGRTLRWFGQDCILTPTIKGEHPLVETTRCRDGTYTFGFDRFDRWVNTFVGLGFHQCHGHHVIQWGALHGLDEATGEQTVLIKSRTSDAFLPFLRAFYRALGRHLAANGWTDLYLQHQADETGDVEYYRTLTETLRTQAPGVRTIDAINKVPEQLSSLVDVPVLAVVFLEKQGRLVESRRESGRETWFYNCCSPPPPYPNRHLDEALTNSRLYPWLGFRFGAAGYLNWGANIYRGADPYKTSVGPVPGGSQDPGHPPGDNWHFYPTEDGLIGGMRMMAFREGLQDSTLLTLLAVRDRERADAIARRLARTLRLYERRPGEFHAARIDLLEALAAP